MIGPNLSEWALRSRQLTIYMMLVTVIAGAFAFINLGRDEDPSFTIKTMLVTAVWPGATLEETQTQLTDRLERQLQETTGLDALRSITRPGITTIYVDLEDQVPPERVPEAWQEVRNGVGDIAQTLPPGVLGPFFNDSFGDVFGIIYAFTADGFSDRELRDHVDTVRSTLLREVPAISKIEWLGVQDEQVLLEFQPDRVAAMGLDYGAIFNAIAAQNVVRPAGVVTTGQENITLRVSGAFETDADLLDVSLVADRRMIRLGDIATVRRALSDPPQPLLRVNGRHAIALAISMREGGDILDLGDRVTAAMSEAVADLPIGIEPVLVSNQPAVVEQAIGEFTTSLWQTVGIILGVSFLMLGVRPGAVVAIAIPVTLAGVFLVMQTLQIDLHRVSLGALIIALALLVDDALTTVDAMLRRLATGDTLEKAATFAYRSLAAPMLTGTLITIAGFVPIGFAKSDAGEYTISLFLVVGIALIASWLVAVLFTPIIGSVLLKAPATGVAEPEPGRILRGFQRFLGQAIRFRWLTFAVTAGLFALAWAGLSSVDRQFFPASDRNELIVDFQLPRSASIFASADAVSRIEAFIDASGEAEFHTSYIGRNVIRFYLSMDIRPPSDHQSQIVVMTKDLAARERLQASLEGWLGDAFPEAISRVSPLQLGPVTGWPVQYRLTGPDIEVLRARALDLAGIVASEPATRDIHFDWIEPARQICIDVDQDRARRLGLTSAQLAAVMNTAITGTRISQLRDDIYLIPIVAQAAAADRLSIDRLETLQVPVPGGRTVALGQFANISFAQEQPFLWRRDRLPTLTVLADVAPGATPEAVVAGLEPKIAAMNEALPPGYEVEVGGTVETSAESQASVFAVVPLMIFIMITLLMIQLQSFRDTGMVLLLLPLGLIGVVGALLTFDRPLGFVAILGILALIGMIAKNAVILITQIDAERAAGFAVREAAIRAATNRFRPLLLTALSTVLGLLPIAPTLFWGPMAFAVMGGLLVATLLTLVFLPTMYVTVCGRESAGHG
ncbi:efflux RND transporter permease subunit [Cereibacter sphaeroides]|uniref:efflux RND transporter permease subunit n=1 Tax=Rhodobacterales TaxID=204455 RepID=UPI000BBE8DA8|nr:MULTISPECIES: efflux RND transporter permease subunit [Paracoccaceae]MCE6960609.1 efflux RND transporter permease subunit [Cereibacter sphaeroides]MCE6970124.1 efflux RND transporter permease subunit [Cereibacter sphaeroides]MCE6971437.1 efflux RND transporter permease subunit [Cereibacter sphaeroides]